MHVILATDASTVADVTTAVVTFLAVLVALFGRDIEKWRKGPILKIVPTVNGFGDVVSDPRITEKPNAPEFISWLRAKVVNDGRETAEDAVVLLTGIEAPQGILRRPPMRELRWADVPTDKINIQPEVARSVDIAHVVRKAALPGQVTQGNYIAGVKSGLIEHSDDDRQTGPQCPLWMDAHAGRYIYHLTVAASNANAKKYTVAFSLRNPHSFQTTVSDLQDVTVAEVS
ncbi:hypothetical protein AB0E74_27855 [Streptomyces sp. NPDC030392]|uniref:hypothetical protein n=1 Tax=Streptomyces sp. NPDC030392 TaxID=3155468 RepID=UPI0033FA1E69